MVPPRPGPLVRRRGACLASTVRSSACEIPEELAVSHEEGPKPFWNSEGPQTVPDILEQLVFEKGGESGGALGIA